LVPGKKVFGYFTCDQLSVDVHLHSATTFFIRERCISRLFKGRKSSGCTRHEPGWPDEFVKKIDQNIDKPILWVMQLCITFSTEKGKKRPKFLVYFCNYQKTSHRKHHSIGEYYSNLAALSASLCEKDTKWMIQVSKMFSLTHLVEHFTT
jgi:hypothetical protein